MARLPLHEQFRQARVARATARMTLRSSTARQLGQIEAARSARAARQGHDLAAYASSVQHTTASFLQQQSASRQQWAQAQRQALQRYRLALRSSTASLISQQAAARRQRAAHTRQWLAAYLDGLRGQLNQAPDDAPLPTVVSVPAPAAAGTSPNSISNTRLVQRVMQPRTNPAASDTNQQRAIVKTRLADAQRPDRSGLYAYARQVRESIIKELEGATNGLNAQQQQQLHIQVEGLRQNVRPFLNDINTVHQMLNDEQRRQLGSYVNGMRRSIASLVTELDTQHYLMADALRRQIGGFVEGLRRDVQALLNEVNATYRLLGGM